MLVERCVGTGNCRHRRHRSGAVIRIPVCEVLQVRSGPQWHPGPVVACVKDGRGRRIQLAFGVQRQAGPATGVLVIARAGISTKSDTAQVTRVLVASRDLYRHRPVRSIDLDAVVPGCCIGRIRHRGRAIRRQRRGVPMVWIEIDAVHAPCAWVAWFGHTRRNHAGAKIGTGLRAIGDVGQGVLIGVARRIPAGVDIWPLIR